MTDGSEAFTLMPVGDAAETGTAGWGAVTGTGAGAAGLETWICDIMRKMKWAQLDEVESPSRRSQTKIRLLFQVALTTKLRQSEC